LICYKNAQEAIGVSNKKLQILRMHVKLSHTYTIISVIISCMHIILNITFVHDCTKQYLAMYVRV